MIVCENCGGRNQPGARFCGSCRAYLSWDETATIRRPGAPPPPGPPAGQPGPPAGQPGPPGGVAPDRKPGAAEPPRQPEQVGVRLELARTAPPVLALGAEHQATATVRNTGSLVDEYVLSVEPRVDWIRVEPSRVSLFPGRDQQVTVVIAPPTVPAPPAGALRYRLVAKSALHPRVAAAADGSVTVGAVDALAAYLEPVAVEAKTRAAARVVLRNNGNRPMPMTVFRADAEPGVRADLAPARLDLFPGQPVAVGVRLRPSRLRWRGEPQRHSYRLRVQPHAGQPIDLDATMVQRPLLARWVLPVVAVLILVPLLALGGMALRRVIADLPSRGGGAGTNQPASSAPNGGGQPSDQNGGQNGGGQNGGGQNGGGQTTEPPPATSPPGETPPPSAPDGSAGGQATATAGGGGGG